VSQVLDFALEEEAFMQACIELVLLEHLENCVQVLKMLFARLGEDEDVIQVDEYKFAHLMPEDLVHDLLERGRGVGETKAEHFELEVPNGRAESRFRHVFRWDADLVVSLCQIDGAEELGSPS
jgi:hypothetical protein